jgi:ribosomal protein S18 acetylase RimI-like enzyme
VDLPKPLATRDCITGDEEFLYAVYASTRMEELAITGWSDSQKEMFLRMQFQAQHRYYHEVYTAASYQIILWEEQPAGRLYVDRRESEIGIVDISLLPQYRGRGIGSILMQRMMAEATEVDKPLRIYVEHFNRALTLYERLGFHKIGDSGVYFHMEWLPNAETSKTSDLPRILAVGPTQAQAAT